MVYPVTLRRIKCVLNVAQPHQPNSAPMILSRLKRLAAVSALPGRRVLIHVVIEPGKAVKASAKHLTLVCWLVKLVLTAEHTPDLSCPFRGQFRFLTKTKFIN